eukprot:415786_1
MDYAYKTLIYKEESIGPTQSHNEITEHNDTKHSLAVINEKEEEELKSFIVHIEDIKSLEDEEVPQTGIKESEPNTIFYAHMEEQEMDKLIDNIDDFIDPKVDDYDFCNETITNCSALKRILHLLKYYKSIQVKKMLNDNDTTVHIYEYMKRVTNKYEISNVMDDWHHVKNIHIKNQEYVEYFNNYNTINCINQTKCMHLARYQRDRNRDIYKIDEYIDHKNLMLMDQLDSIHSYIYHTSPQYTHEMQNKYFLSITDEKKTNMPETFIKCTVDQVLFIMNNVNVFDNLDQLDPYKTEIIKYFRNHEFDGKQLIVMKRKTFMKQLAAEFNSTKLTAHFGRLYRTIVGVDMSLFQNQ